MYTRFTHRCTKHQCKSTFPTLLVNSLFFGTISEFLQFCLGSTSPEAIVDWDHQQNPTSSRLNLTLPPQNHHHSIRPQPAGPHLRATVLKFKKWVSPSPFFRSCGRRGPSRRRLARGWRVPCNAAEMHCGLLAGIISCCQCRIRSFSERIWFWRTSF